MWLPLLGLILGISLGLLTDIQIPEIYESYLSIAVLAALDTLFGGIRAQLQHVYDDKVFVSGFFFNIGLSSSTCFFRGSSWSRFIFSCHFCIWCSIIPKYSSHSPNFIDKMVGKKK